MSLALPDRVKQGGLLLGGILGVLLPQALPVLLALALLVAVVESLAAGGLSVLREFGAWHRARPALLLLALPGLALLLAPWAEWPGLAVGRAGRLAVEILLALVLAAHLLTLLPSVARRRGTALAVGLSAGAALAAVDLLSGGWLTQALRDRPVDAITYGRSAVLAALSVLPILLLLPQPGWYRLALALPGLLLAALSVNLAAKLLLPVALLAAGLGLWRRGALGLVGAGVLLVALPVLLPVGLTPAQDCALWASKPSAAHRLLIWTYADGLIAARPWTGWGLDAARRLGSSAPEAAVPDCARASLGRDHVPLLPLHPHNGALQLWLELGVLGALFLPLLLMVAARSIMPMPRVARMAASAALAGGLVPILFSFGLWQGWWLAALTLYWGFLLLLFSARS